MITNDYNKELRVLSDALRDLGYTDATIYLRQRYWRKYYEYNGSFDINEDVMNDYLSSECGIKPNNVNLSKKNYEERAALRNLLEWKQNGRITTYHTPWFKDLPWVESFKPVIDEFLSYQKNVIHNKPDTIINYQRTLKRFTNYLHSKNISFFDELKREHVTSFLADSINEVVKNIHAMLCHLRTFFRYLYLHNYNSDDLSLVIPKSSILFKRKHIPTTWTREDVQKILDSIDVANPVGKRDYAIILLVARLGIRVSDVIRLEFKNIKWEKNCIEFVQYKTNTPVVLPLFEDVGNAIINYIQNGRPICDINNIFITHKPPFAEFSENNHLYGMFNKYLLRSGIEVTPEKNHGMHTLRHTLATELLRKNVPIPVISEILGHNSLESTMNYLRADSDQLRYCTLIEGENYAK